MRRRPSALTDDASHATRFAWWAAFLATIALVVLLGLAREAQAVTLPASTGPAPATTDDEEAEGEGVEGEAGDGEECELEEDEEGEEECVEGTAAASEAPRECLLSDARATVVASRGHDRLRLIVRYRTSSPSTVAVSYGLHGSKGALYLGDETERFGKQGVLHLTTRLSEAQMAKVIAARGFTVRLRMLAAPSWCHPFFDRQLSVRRATPSGLAWSQPE